MSLIFLDCGKPKPFLEIIGRPRNLAWPVNVHRVTLPDISDEGESLNAFERVILKLLDAGGPGDAETLAEETCMPKDLVQSVILRLQDRSYIDEYNRIVQHQRDDWAKSERAQANYVTALLFRELSSGKILPYLHVLSEAKPFKKREENDDGFLKISWDNTFRNKPAEPRDVISAVRAMRKRSRVFGGSTSLPSVQLITIAEEPEFRYLDCPIGIQMSDGEPRIADPFGNGYSLLLESRFNHLRGNDSKIENWVMDWQRNLTAKAERNNQEMADREPYDNEANRKRYPNLVFNLRLRKNKQYRSIEQLYAGIEWALFYSCTQRAYSSAVQRLKLANQSEHPALLKAAAESLSLSLPKSGLHPVTQDKLNAFLSGKADLVTVLSISLLMVKDDASHPLRGLASKYQDFIMRLFDVKKVRDESMHGSDKERRKDVNLPEEDFAQGVISALLPSFRFSDGPIAEVDHEADADSLLGARVSLQGEFGFALFNRLGVNIQERLIAAERFWLSCGDGGDALSFVNDIYAAMQSAFRMALSGVPSPDIKDSEYIATARKNAADSGLGELPKSLATVRLPVLRETLLGNDQSLQACAMAFLLVSDAEALAEAALRRPGFLGDVARVVDSRAHGNEPLPLSRDEIYVLRKAAFVSLKTLMEV